MKKIVEKWNHASVYAKSLLCFVGFCCILSLGFLGYVYTSLSSYENNLIENYIVHYFRSGEVLEMMDEDSFQISEFEKNNASLEQGLKELFDSKEVKIKKNGKESTDETHVYEILVNKKPISKISLVSTKSTTKMMILKIDHWKVTDVEMNLEEGLYSYDITLPATYQLTVNDQKVDDQYVVKKGDVEGLDRVTSIVPIFPTKTYQINGFVQRPEIHVFDENQQEVEFKLENNVTPPEFKMIEDEQTATKQLKEEFDILALAQNWSLFLTDDLGGQSHGFYKLSPYLIEDTYMYEMAFGWAHNVDITFVSEHTLKNPAFTNQKVSNFIFYNENAFSCEVYLEKNMRLFYGDKQDVMHDRLYFVYQDGGYKLVDMQSIAEK